MKAFLDFVIRAAMDVSNASVWGPYILAALLLLAGVAGWAFRRAFNRLDKVIDVQNALVTEVAVIKSRISTVPQRRKDKEEADNE